jgi:hypothetical protein
MRDLEPEIDGMRLYSQPPVDIGGDSLFDLPDKPPLGTCIGISTDIFFPRNLNAPQDAPPLDNRILARLNGARLYAFLHEVRDAAIAIGGVWSGYPPGRSTLDIDFD